MKEVKTVAFSTFTSRDRYTVFPMGGIGTGTIGLNACGELTDFEIFNHSDKGCKLPYQLIAMHVEGEGVNDTRALKARSVPAYEHSFGYHRSWMHGLPQFAASRQQVRYPFCEIAFEQPGLPVEVSLTAMNPLVPLNVHDSAIPAIMMRYRVRNTSDKPLSVLICACLPSIYGLQGFDHYGNQKILPGGKNIPKAEDGLYGIHLTGEGLAQDDLYRAEMAIFADDENALLQPYWYRGGWQDGLTLFWKALSQGRMDTMLTGNEAPNGPIGPRGAMVGAVGIRRELQPHQEEDFTFVISWYVPNRRWGWGEGAWTPPIFDDKTMRNDYANHYASAWEAGRYLMKNLTRLEGVSRTFADALYGSTLPESVIESAAYSISVLRSNTCFLGPDGAFYGWEGCHKKAGSCPGNCTHVWNYAQTVAYLFPSLERSARRIEFLTEMDEQGMMPFRTQQTFGYERWSMYAAADGQFGTLVRLWREYLLSGDREFLKELYPKACLAMAYAQQEWDPDGDGVPEARQHNTYDVDFYGPNPLIGLLYLAALRAMAAMADEMGDSERAKIWQMESEKGAAALEKECFNGEWYVQQSTREDQPYQFGSGVLSDQLFGQTLASLAGLGKLLPEEHLKSAAESIWKYNFCDGTVPRTCLQRCFAEPDEAGLRMCSWPRGGEPALPFIYSDEVWSGVEYQVATVFVYLGLLDQSKQIVDAIRKRHDGNTRNPYIEVEAGYHYARSMAAWGLLQAYSGMHLSPDGNTTFDPCIHEESFRSLYSDGRTWGIFTQNIENGVKLQRRHVLGRQQ